MDDWHLVDNKTVLTVQTDKYDPTSSYKSTLPNDLVVQETDNIYDEFVKSVNKFTNFNTLGVRYLYILPNIILYFSDKSIN